MVDLAVGTSQPHIALHEGQPITTSQDVAAFFEKRHSHVLREIRKLLASMDLDHQPNFGLMIADVEIGKGATRTDPIYRITRDGFTLLAMGFTGQRALEFKLAYIDAFNRMEAQLRNRPTSEELAALESKRFIENHFNRNRFLGSIDENGKVTMTPVPDRMCVLDPMDKEHCIQVMLTAMPAERLPEIINAAAARMAERLKVRADR